MLFREARSPRAEEQMANVYLIGTGPGAADLLTLRAARLLKEAADVVLTDDLVSAEILAMVRPGARVLRVGKRGGRHVHLRLCYPINQLMEDAAGQQHKRDGNNCDVNRQARGPGNHRLYPRLSPEIDPRNTGDMLGGCQDGILDFHLRGMYRRL